MVSNCASLTHSSVRFLYYLSLGSRRTILHCAHRTKKKWGHSKYCGHSFQLRRGRTATTEGAARLSFIGRIGRAPFHRARTASKKDGLASPFPPPSSPTSLHEGGLVDPRLRASNEGSPRPRVARAQEINSLHSLLCSNHLLGEWPRLPFTARIERPPLHRGGSASKKGTWPLPFPPPSLLVISQGWGLIDLPLRASNEGLLRPRVARAQEINRLHPLRYSHVLGA